ncbi:YihY/virulence factor BrkB family protein [Methylopila henanensis]|uniref:YihY/virulence factor BrkB family protein n=1 Tax=Methylopila henanensis TaxID=873516 RepID=A0ABW4K1H4_9HYPH
MSASARGRDARAPQDFPVRGWRDIALRLYGQIAEDRLLAVAAGVTFYALLAIFPALVALVSLYGLTADLSTLDAHLATLQGVVPRAGLDIVRDQVARIVTKSDGALGFAFAFGLGAALWSANAGMKAMFDALNVVYEEKERRSFVVLNLTSLAFTFGGILFVLIAFNAVVVLPIALEFVGLGGRAEALLQFGRWPVLFVGVLAALTLLYRFGPSRRPPKWRWAAPGSVLAGALWVGGSLAFSWYAENLATYNETYGSLGAAIGFMTWIWMSAAVVLLGGELNAEMEHQTRIDSTVGAPRPLGLRGAAMADQVAP